MTPNSSPAVPVGAVDGMAGVPVIPIAVVAQGKQVAVSLVDVGVTAVLRGQLLGDDPAWQFDLQRVRVETGASRQPCRTRQILQRLREP